MSDAPEDLLEIHNTLMEEIRHSDGLVWQFGLAVVALEDGAVVLSEQTGFQSLAGKSTLVAGFLVSVGLSFVLLRHAYDRRGFVQRLRAVEGDLRVQYPKYYPEKAGSPQWFAAMVLAWVLMVESSAGFVLFVSQLVK